MTGDEAEAATVGAIDRAVLLEQPYLRIIHGKGTGVVRDRVLGVVSQDGRVARHEFAKREAGGTGVTIVEFTP
jgi:DNA mismatch repair protein MutS2